MADGFILKSIVQRKLKGTVQMWNVRILLTLAERQDRATFFDEYCLGLVFEPRCSECYQSRQQS